ncbi:MAG: ATP-binding protein [Pseudomonadota bacterium]|nr:ATP-binding protein [Pseudomonadota bacterium]
MSFARKHYLQLLLLLTPFLLLAFAVFYGLYLVERRDLHASISAQHHTSLLRSEQTLRTILLNTEKDIDYLANLSSAKAWSHSPSESVRQTLAEDFINFMRRYPDYDQIRYLNHAGQETVRIDNLQGAATAVSQADLQDKSRRYYWHFIRALPPGGVYASPLDLNVENGVISQPLKPMLRIAKAIYVEGRFQGAIILNLQGQRLLSQLIAENTDQQAFWLVNEKGFWMQGPSPDLEWTFMWPDKQHINLLSEYPELANAFDANTTTTVETGAGLFTLATLSDLQPPVNGKPRHWKIIAFTAAAYFDATLKSYVYNLLQAFAAVAVLIVITCTLIIKKDKSLDWARQQSIRSESQFRSLLESAPDAIITLDESRVVRMANSMALATTGQALSALMDHPIERIFPPDQMPALQRAIAEVGSNPDHIVTLETELLMNDGSRIPVEARISPAGGEQGLVTCILRDITQRKAHDAKVQSLNHSLQKRSRDLESSNAELEAFSYSVSHDLRAPLRALDGFSKTLLEEYGEQLDERGQHRLQRIRAAAQKMGVLIDDMLNLSRVSRTEVQRSSVDISAMANHIVQDLQQRSPKTNATIQVQPGMQGEADPSLLRIALMNLLENAWKFTGKTEAPSIEIKQIHSDDEQSAVYCVSDNGAGFNMEYQKKLFTAFQRLHDARDYPGTGIGLATVKRVISKHGGRIWAKGEEGHGASFHFTLGESV